MRELDLGKDLTDVLVLGQILLTHTHDGKGPKINRSINIQKYGKSLQR